MARARTTKTLAKRIELDYFQKPHPFRTRMRWLSWAGAALAALAVGFCLWPSRRIAWSAGDLTPPHSLFQADCAACHARSPGGPVADAACTACHAGPAHQKDQTGSPACASCHAEHRGRPLKWVDDSHCAACHADLKSVKGPVPASTGGNASPEETARRVTAFPGGHPEFRAVTLGRDEARLRLNHELHLKPDLRGPRGPVSLTCDACHVVDGEGRLMRPVDYEGHCGSCHPLTFDTEGRLPPGSVVPHGDPAEALRRLIELYAGTAVLDAGAVGASDPVAAALSRQRERRARLENPAYVPLSQASGTERAYVVERVGLAVRILERQTCAFCHGAGSGAPLPAAAPPPAGGSILPSPPAVPKPEVPSSWMPHARFAHRAHRSLACAACHPGAGASRSTSDVLVPGKEVCATCHYDGGGAPASCVNCHAYHQEEEDPLGPSRFGLPRGRSWLREVAAPAPHGRR